MMMATFMTRCGIRGVRVMPYYRGDVVTMSRLADGRVPETAWASTGQVAIDRYASWRGTLFEVGQAVQAMPVSIATPPSAASASEMTLGAAMAWYADCQ
jgi:hypothetical protein